ncbi:MOSC N-terminal beta barrel domain-containing protein [Pseudomonas sp. TH41]|uniref:MOSC domain-containing protein n=1 Tax=Pseudomonas sp. TH41 TaxID=2796405 RepID=UPI0019130452|nr:MOSC N-terminal beta barrel domain-containing protein [Pseudomonas sp. TH41]MBK5356107.1 MOSC N-terminal beta barrel domain-containing protein [Pseudomonas sp. TH41]
MIVGRVREIWRYPVKSMGGEKLLSCTVGNMGIPGDRGWALRDDVAGEIRGAKNMPTLLQHASRYREQPVNGQTPHVDIRLPDGTHIGSDDPQVNARLSALLGRAVSLWPLQPASDKAHYRRGQAGAAFIGMLSRNRVLRPLLEKLLPYTSFETMTRELLSREPGEPLLDYASIPSELFEFTSPPGTYFDLAPLHLLTTSSLAAMKRLNPSAAWDARRFRPNFLIETEGDIEGLVEAGWEGRTLRLGGLSLTCGIPTLRCGMTAHAQSDLPKDSTVLRSIVRDAGQNLGIYAHATKSSQVAVGDVVELL